MGKREEQRRQADRIFEECRQAIARLSDAELCESLLDVPHRKWLEIEPDTHTAIGILAHRAAQRIAELTKATASKSEWRSVATDPPPPAMGDQVVIVFSGDAYSVEYANEVNPKDHVKWIEFSLAARSVTMDGVTMGDPHPCDMTKAGDFECGHKWDKTSVPFQRECRYCGTKRMISVRGKTLQLKSECTCCWDAAMCVVHN
jgi:hypothetical protein